ncbi:Uncharacterised protein g802 [Pycnogonum litorale]
MSIWRTPFTDMTGNFMTTQYGGRCADIELTAMECIEAYGYHHSKTKCEAYIDDWNECRFLHKQMKRIHLMKEERKKQYAAGKREKLYEDAPKLDGSM